LSDPLEIRKRDYELCDDLKSLLKAQRVNNQTLIVQHPDVIPTVHCLERTIAPMRPGSKAFIMLCLQEWKAAVEELPESGKHIPVDGPIPVYGFRWKGKSRDVPPQPWELLNFMWDKEEVAAKEAIKKLWASPPDNEDGALKSVIFRVNDLMRDLEVPFQISRKKHYVRVVKEI